MSVLACVQIRQVNRIKNFLIRFKKPTRKWLQVLILNTMSFLFLKEVILRLEQNDININKFRYKNKQVYSIYLQNVKFENHMESFLSKNEDNSRNVYIKDINKFIYHKTKHKKQQFCTNCSQCFHSKETLTNHREAWLKINCKQGVKLSKECNNIKFGNFRNICFLHS